MWKRNQGGEGGGEPVPVVLYTRAGCHLCEEMQAELARARPAVPYELTLVDVDSDPELARLHGLSIPVLEIAGRPAFKGRLTADDFAAKLLRRARERRAT
jgi:hypothetical protein